MQGERGVRPDLGDQVVVVRIEPLGHLERRDVGGAARRGEVPVERILDPRDAGRQGAEQFRGVEHLVVVAEGVGGYGIQPGGDEPGPLVAPEPGGGRCELGPGDRALPVALDNTLELTAGADAGNTEDGAGEIRCGHCGTVPFVRSRGGPPVRTHVRTTRGPSTCDVRSSMRSHAQSARRHTTGRGASGTAGRYSDSQARLRLLPAAASQAQDPVHPSRLSFLLTAAGQSRIPTGFPLDPRLTTAPRHRGPRLRRDIPAARSSMPRRRAVVGGRLSRRRRSA